MISKKQKHFCTTLNYIEHLLFLASTIAGCVSISLFASLFGTPLGITSYAIGLKVYVVTAGIKKYKSTIKKKKKKYDKIVLLAKCNFNLKVLIDSVISHEEFVSINNVLKDYEEMKEETKNLKT